MVAAGGGGSGTAPSTTYLLYGGYGGGLVGGSGGSTSPQYITVNTGGEQTSTGNCNTRPSSLNPTDYGSFGYANQTVLAQDSGDGYGGGGGGGWYGGLKGFGRGGSGGSSFISGHPGCNAVNPSTGAHLGVSTTMTINNVNYRFTNTVMKAGNESMPSPTGGTEIGHGGNGYCKITWHPAL